MSGISQTSDITTIYYGARSNVIKMMKNREYKVPTDLDTLTPKEFEVMFDKRQMDISGVFDHKGLPVYVRIIEPTRQFNKAAEKQSVFREAAKYFNSIGMADITDEKSLETAFNDGHVRLIIIYNSRQAGQIQNKYEEEYITHAFMEVYQVHMMNIDPLKGFHQSKWRLLTDQDEVNKILKQYESKNLQFGALCIDDPMNRYYGGRPQENGQRPDYYECITGTRLLYRKVISKRMNLKK